MDLLAHLDRSPLKAAREAAQAIREGWRVSFGRDSISFRELERVYRVRLDLLRQRSGQHALQLACGVEELLANIPKANSQWGHWITIDGGGVHHFNVLLCGISGSPIGCLRVVSKSAVSESDWIELWQSAP
ncbi:hypothetical protein [Lysobacter humi (ex Lee et al. 2017)]